METRDDLRTRVAALRREGLSRAQIQEALGPISKRLIDEALQDVPPPE